MYCLTHLGRQLTRMEPEDWGKAAIGGVAIAAGLKGLQMLLTEECPCGGRRPKSPLKVCSSCGKTPFSHASPSNNYLRSLRRSYLQRWTKLGARITAKDTHDAVRGALSEHRWNDVGKSDHDIYLQGSYRNYTTIYEDSDVDVVVELTSWYVPRGNLDIAIHRETGREDPSIDVWRTFRREVLGALRDRFGFFSVDGGNKALKAHGNSNRRDADVLVCMTYGHPDNAPQQGIIFRDRGSGRWIVNYPKQHYQNAVDKHADGRTGGWYKKAVRMFKNCRSYLAENWRIDDATAPSYFIEGLLYNVPDARFGPDPDTTFYQCLEWLVRELSSGKGDGWTAVNGIQELFGPHDHQWNERDALEFLEKASKLWFHG